MNYMVRNASKDDWDQIKNIYKEGISTGLATFETKVPSSYEQWILKAHPECTLIVYEENTTLGWCKLSTTSDRLAYTGVGEVSIYVHPSAKRKGVGDLLLKNLIVKSEEQGFWTLQAVIFLENKGSVHLHQKNGFRVVGIRERIGKINGIWRDNVLLERRSLLVGLEE
ncbi:GNAT family N-acetyltransferase [Psychrobacillus sp. NPDC058041]|uniref:GNAT family N-acetyltransferase n=1 Tax=Psychrobacillus sp. NPDC058041 TaxID=3346310 RepID=UPI0036DBDA47